MSGRPEGVEEYPLSWPFSKPRTPKTKRSRSRFDQSPGQARDKLLQELRRLCALEVVISTNVALKRDGMPYANQQQAIDDPGVAIYFNLFGTPTVLACDRWLTVGDNMYAIALHIDSLRGQDRWGVGSLAQAFAGYAALPPATPMGPPKREWFEVLGVHPHFSTDDVKSAYRKKATAAHPDCGGSHDAMSAVNVAYDEFKRERGLNHG